LPRSPSLLLRGIIREEELEVELDFPYSFSKMDTSLINQLTRKVGEVIDASVCIPEQSLVCQLDACPDNCQLTLAAASNVSLLTGGSGATLNRSMPSSTLSPPSFYSLAFPP
jgi:hypothetical protein